ncbi:hypothetical protein LCGC14_0587830 [marine sediment metagenome]|uniref:Chromosomal replication initiator DnaA C-terminal domain-containing protein n=1 Tax=marine sediment metagenome TaxID=412755 RepID=A0A0F9REI4_9ZZZZ
MRAMASTVIKCVVCHGTGELRISKADVLAGIDLSALAREIIDEVAHRHGILPGDLIGMRRFPRLVRPRQEAVVRLRDELDMTWKAVGLILGGRDHSTMIYSYRRARGETALEVKRRKNGR